MLGGWVILSAAMFMYLFGILDASNRHTLDAMSKQRKDLALLKAEKQSYTQAQADLQELSKKSLQPDSFFSKDINLVNELRILEDWSRKLNITMQLSGLSGTVNTAPKAKTATPIVVVPYGISLTGSFSQVTNFLEVLENLSFITNVNGLSLSSANNNLVNASLSANFYLQK